MTLFFYKTHHDLLIVKGGEAEKTTDHMLKRGVFFLTAQLFLIADVEKSITGLTLTEQHVAYT